MNVVVSCGLKRVKLVKVEKKGLLFLSYGSPSSKEDLVPYMTSIRHGRVPTEGEIANLTRRYDVIDQWSNLELQKMAENQYKTLMTLLPTMPSAVGYLHMKPSIAEAVDSLALQGVEHIIAIGNHGAVTFDFIRSWWDQPAFTEYWKKAVVDCVNATEDIFVIFSAHSIPLIDNHGGDSYAFALHESAKEIAEHCKLSKWTVAWQSAAPHGQWLGPTVEEAIDQALQTGAAHIAFVPFGFVSNHVEVLYDNDVECKELVENGGAMYLRAQMPNCNETFLQAMASAIVERIHS